MCTINYKQNYSLIILLFLTVIIWLGVNYIFVLGGLNWIEDTDSGWYWSVASNLDAFDSAVTIGYPLLWRSLSELFPRVDANLLGQAISFLTYIAMVVTIYQLLKAIEISRPLVATLLIVMFPLVGVTFSVLPRANSLLRFLTFLALFAYVKDKKWLFILAIAFIPLVHRSAIPMIGLLVLIGMRQGKVKIWMLALILLPLGVYWLAGAVYHNDAMWYLRGYQNNDKILGLFIGDGLLGTIVLGLRGALNDLLQGMIVLCYWLLAVFLLISKIWKEQLFLLALIIPVIFLGLTQPADEIWSTYNYTTYFSIPVLFFLQKKGVWPLNRYFEVLLIAGFFFSQFAWSLYSLYYFA